MVEQKQERFAPRAVTLASGPTCETREMSALRPVSHGGTEGPAVHLYKSPPTT